MRCGVALLFVTALAAQTPAAGPLTLELRAFNGAEEVTPHVRVTVHRAGERGDPLTQSTSADGHVELKVPPGIYDVQAIHERDGRVIDIRWANRLVVMPYPDERGHHLEVVNFKNGFGALEVRGKSGKGPDVALYEAGKHDKPFGTAMTGSIYTLFVIPAGSYDLLSHAAARSGWHTDIDVPLDRTRLWIVE